MELTIDQAQKIRLLSDGELYDKAVNFVTEHPDYTHSKVSKTQLSGLQNAVGVGDWAEILGYIKNRLNRNTTSDDLEKFYQDLENYLNELYGQVEKFFRIEEGLNRTQRTQAKRRYAYLLAKEFIQHLVAETNCQQQIGERPQGQTGKRGPKPPAPDPSGDKTMSEAFRRAGVKL